MIEPVTLLVIDDDADFLHDFEFLVGDKYKVITTQNPFETLPLIKEHSPEIVFLDLFLGDNYGLDILKQIKSEFPHQSCIIITEHSSIGSAVEAIKLGAENYISKNFNVKEIQAFVEQVLNKKIERAKNEALMEVSYGPYQKLIGESQSILQIKEKIELAASSDFLVLVTGESGTGKELVARLIHKYSKRSEEIFLPVNCGAIPSELIESELFGYEKGAFTGATRQKLGKFEIASNGTIFLDEISELNPDAQVKLLRVLYNKEFERIGGNEVLKTNARIIAATNRNLDQLVREGKIREDLYYRLNVFPIEIPPLRERKEDIPLLVEYFIRIKSREFGKDYIQIDPKSIELFLEYEWPGNIRELENIITRLILLAKGNIITYDLVKMNLPISRLHRQSYFSENDLTWEKMNQVKKSVLEKISREIEREFIDKVMKKYGQNIIKASKELGVNKTTLYRMINKSREK